MSLTPTAHTILRLVEEALQKAEAADLQGRALYEATCAWRGRWLQKNLGGRKKCPYKLERIKKAMSRAKKHYRYMKRVKKVAERVLADEQRC